MQRPGISRASGTRLGERGKARHQPRCGAGTDVPWAWIAIARTSTFRVVRAGARGRILASARCL